MIYNQYSIQMIELMLKTIRFFATQMQIVFPVVEIEKFDIDFFESWYFEIYIWYTQTSFKRFDLCFGVCNSRIYYKRIFENGRNVEKSSIISYLICSNSQTFFTDQKFFDIIEYFNQMRQKIFIDFRGFFSKNRIWKKSKPNQAHFSTLRVISRLFLYFWLALYQEEKEQFPKIYLL